MQKISKFVAAVSAGLVATCGVAMASPTWQPVPEPGSWALVALGLAGAVYFSSKGKK